MLAISPHALTVVAADSPSAEGSAGTGGDAHLLPGTVVSVGFARGRATARVMVSDWGEQTAAVDASTILEPGQNVLVRVDPGGLVQISRHPEAFC